MWWSLQYKDIHDTTSTRTMSVFWEVDAHLQISRLNATAYWTESIQVLSYFLESTVKKNRPLNDTETKISFWTAPWKPLSASTFHWVCNVLEKIVQCWAAHFGNAPKLLPAFYSVFLGNMDIMLQSLFTRTPSILAEIWKSSALYYTELRFQFSRIVCNLLAIFQSNARRAISVPIATDLGRTARQRAMLSFS